MNRHATRVAILASAASADKMSFDERASFAQEQFKIMGICMKGS